MSSLVLAENAEEDMRRIVAGQKDFTRMVDDIRTMGRLIGSAMTIGDISKVTEEISVQSGNVAWKLRQRGINDVDVFCVVSHGPEQHQKSVYSVHGAVPVGNVEEAYGVMALFVAKLRTLFPSVEKELSVCAKRGRILEIEREVDKFAM